MISRASVKQTGTYIIRTFGCQMNVHDSEHIAGVLEGSGYVPAASLEEASLVVFNTCSVRESAENRVWGQLGALAGRRNGLPLIAVCGCMAQRHGEEITRRCPHVDLVFGLSKLEELPRLLSRARSGSVCETGNIDLAAIDSLPSRPGSATRAWVPVGHGCDNRCSYCVVPRVRGSARSRAPEEITRETRELAGRGVIEITLLGQNVNAYGLDLDPPLSFAALLESVSRTGIARVKFETSHPRDLSDDLLRVMADSPALCEYLHLPVQSGSDRVLAAMKRVYRRDFYLERAAEARRAVPGLVLSTDIMVGFPGETEEDFLETMDLVRTVRFDAAYMFIYSRREGTTAANMSGELTYNEKLERLNRLCRLQDEITAGSLGEMVGRRVEVLVGGMAKKGDFLSGRTRGNRVVLLPAGGAYEGELVTALIRAAGKHSMTGEVS